MHFYAHLNLHTVKKCLVRTWTASVYILHLFCSVTFNTRVLRKYLVHSRARLCPWRGFHEGRSEGGREQEAGDEARLQTHLKFSPCCKKWDSVVFFFQCNDEGRVVKSRYIWMEINFLLRSKFRSTFFEASTRSCWSGRTEYCVAENNLVKPARTYSTW